MLKLLKSKNTFPANPQIFDLLQLSRKEHDCKMLCTRAIRQFEAWKAAQDQSSPLTFDAVVEGARLRRRAHQTVLFYKMVKDNRMKVFQAYIEKLPLRINTLRSAS